MNQKKSKQIRKSLKALNVDWRDKAYTSINHNASVNYIKKLFKTNDVKKDMTFITEQVLLQEGCGRHSYKQNKLHT